MFLTRGDGKTLLQPSQAEVWALSQPVLSSGGAAWAVCWAVTVGDAGSGCLVPRRSLLFLRLREIENT